MLRFVWVMCMTLEAWVTSWITLRSAGLRPRTLESYRALLRLHIAPALGTVELSELSPERIMAMLAPLCAAGHTRTAELCYILLRAALGDALRLRHVAANPMDAVMRPKHHQQRPAPWSPEDVQRYVIGIRGDKHRVAWLLALQCGLRRGEICGLRWSDVDLRGRVLHIRNQRVRLDDGRLIDQPPKTESGVRDVPIPDGLVRILRGAYRLGDGYVDPISPGALDAAHRACVRRLGLPPLTLHGLRHTMATNALRNGASMRALQMVLGHADFRTTAMIYAHPDMAMLRRVVDAAVAGVVY